MKSIKETVSTLRGIIAAAYTASVNGPAIDLANFASNKVTFAPGTITDGTHTPKLQESDASGSGYTDVAAADMDGTLAALASNTLQSVAYIGTKRYIRCVVTVASATTGGVYSATVDLGNSRKTPV